MYLSRAKARVAAVACIAFVVNSTFECVDAADSSLTAAGDPLSHWVQRQVPGVRPPSIQSVIHGPDQFVAVGADGFIATSPLGATWTVRSSGVKTSLTGVTFARGVYVAVGESGVVLTSPDAIAWTRREVDTDRQFNSVVAAGNQYVAVGAGGLVMTSSDGLAWQPRTTGTTAELRSVAYGGGYFVAVGRYGTLLVSSDGVVWRGWSSSTTVNLNGVAFISGVFVAVGDEGTMVAIIVSRDVASCKLRDAHTNRSLAAIGEHRGVMLIVGEQGALLSSVDGNNWVARPAGTTLGLNCVFSCNASLAVAGQSGILLQSGELSPNPLDEWRRIELPVGSVNLTGVRFLNGNYLVVGQAGTIVTSHDAKEWQLRQSGTRTNLCRAAFGANRYVVVGAEGTVLSSADAAAWTRHDVGTRRYLSGVEYAAGVFVAVGERGTVIVSPDGLNWKRRDAPNSANLGGIEYIDGRFYAVGGGGSIMTSNDGLKWNQVRLERSEQTLYDIAVLDDRLFTVGVDGGIKSLRDGASWEISGPRGLGELQQIIRQSGLLMAVGNGGVILASTDGLNWLRHESGTARVLFGVAFAQGRFLVVGEAGTCLQSGLLASP